MPNDSQQSIIYLKLLSLKLFLSFLGVVHEHPRIGSDGESEEGSRTSEDVVSPPNRPQMPSTGGAVGSGQGNTNLLRLKTGTHFDPLSRVD